MKKKFIGITTGLLIIVVLTFSFSSCGEKNANGANTGETDALENGETSTNGDATGDEIIPGVPRWSDVSAEYSDKMLYSTLKESTEPDFDGKGNSAILISGNGAYLKYGFNGTGVSVFIASDPEKYCTKVKAYLDGVETETINLSNSGMGIKFIRNGLPNGEHTIRFVNVSPSENGDFDTWIYRISVNTSAIDPTVILDPVTHKDIYYAPDTPVPEEILYIGVSKTEFSIDTPSTHIALILSGDNLFVTSMKNPDADYEWIDGDIKVTLPESLKPYNSSENIPITWHIKSVGENTDNDTGYILRFLYECEEVNFTLEDIWSHDVSDGPVEHKMYIHNNTNKDYVITSQQSLDLIVKAELEPTLWRFYKENFAADPTGTYRDYLTDGKYISALSTTRVDTSITGSGFIPSIVFDAAGNHGFYVCLEWPHGRVAASRTGSEMIVQAGVADDFKTKIEAHNSFFVPTAYLGAYKGDLDDGTNILKNWFVAEKAPEKLLQDENEPQTQVGFYLSPTENDFSAMGIRSLKLDYGWWEGESEGIWEPNEWDILAKLKSYGCNSLADFGSMLNSKDVGLTLYVLLHDAKMEGTDILTSAGKNGHPEWFTDRKASLSESADLGNIECVAFLKNKLYRLFTENNVTTWRTDMEPMPWSSIYQNRHVFGNIDTTYWVATGFYDILDYLYETIPGFRYENCGSGGAYKDFATMSRSLVVQLEDRSNITNIRRTFYTSSYMFSPLQLGCVVGPDTFNPNVDTYMGYDFDFGLRSCIMGVPMICVWKGAAGGHYLYGLEDKVSEYFNMYCDKVVPIQRGGNTYHILPRPDDINWDGMEFYNPSSGNGVVFLFKPTDTEGSLKTIYLDGLDEDAQYSLEFQDNLSANCTMTGKTLMENGISVKIDGEFGSEMIWISKQ